MDKIYHFTVNLVLGFSAVFSLPFALGICIGASIGKEVGDILAKRDAWDWKDSAWDLVADTLGATIGIVAGCLLRRVG